MSFPPITPAWTDVREFRQQPAKYFSRHAERADTIYYWIGNIVRPKRRFWDGNQPSALGIVVEVGRGRWLAALWADGKSPREHVSVREVDVWHPPHCYDLKGRLLAREVPDEELLAILGGADLDKLPRVY